MKKVHNTRSNGEETITAPQKTIHKETGEKIPVSPGTASSSTTGSTSLDWLEIMEGEEAAENLQRELEVDDTPAKNSTGFGVEGSGNLCDGRSGEVTSPDLHTGSSINIDAISDSNKKIRNDVPNKETKSWSGLFTKLTRGKATYSTFSPRINISTKNNNALMFDIQKLNKISINDIVSTLYGKMGADFIGAKPHFVRGTRMYLEIIFADEQKMRKYAKEGIDIFQQTFYGYISSRSNQELLSVRLRRVPITDKEVITEEIKEVFENVGTIKAIKPLLYEGTPIQSDQWVIIFDITEDSKLTQRIPRYINILDQKVVTEWKEAPKLCFFCDGEGHIKRDCNQLKEANNLSRQYKEFKELKNKQVTKEETLVPVQDIEAEKTENTSHNSNQEPTVQETEVVEQDIQMDDVANLPETEGAQSSLFTERVEMSVNVEPSITGNIAPVNLIANNRESAWKVNNTSHDQPNPINSRNEDITQPKEGDEFTKVTYSKKKKKSNNIKKDKREYSGPYKKSKTLQ